MVFLQFDIAIGVGHFLGIEASERILDHRLQALYLYALAVNLRRQSELIQELYALLAWSIGEVIDLEALAAGVEGCRAVVF